MVASAILLESAMGAAVESVEGAQAMLVPRSRFRPVKTTADLLLLRSDRYRLDADGGITAVDDTPDPRIDLSAEFVLIDDFEARFPRGVPQLRQCTSFELSGDVVVGGGVIGLEYTFSKVPISLFLDGTLFMEIFDDPFLFRPQAGTGARFRF